MLPSRVGISNGGHSHGNHQNGKGFMPDFDGLRKILAVFEG